MPQLLTLQFSPHMLAVTPVLERLLPGVLEAVLRKLTLAVDVGDDSVLSPLAVLLPQKLPLESLDALAELIELDKQALVVILQLVGHLRHRILLPLLLVQLLPPVLLTIRKFLKGVVSFMGESL